MAAQKETCKLPLTPTGAERNVPDMDKPTTNCDPRIRAAEKLLRALAECESVCGDFGTQTMIVSPLLAATMMLLGGKTVIGKDGTATVDITRDGAELLVGVEPVNEYDRIYKHGFRLGTLLDSLIDAVVAAMKAGPSPDGDEIGRAAWVRVYEIKGEIVEASNP